MMITHPASIPWEESGRGTRIKALAGPALRPPAARAGVDVLLDELAFHVSLSGAGEQRRRVIVAEHRQHDDHASGKYPLGGERQGHAHKSPGGAGPEVARSLNHARVDAVGSG